MIRLGILGSTRGTNLTPIVEAQLQKKLHANVKVVVSNKEDAFILERAKSFKIPAFFQNPHGLSREEYDRKISALLRAHDVELIILIGYMRILSAEFVCDWQNKIINVHPSLLPLHKGKMDLEVHRAVLATGENESGCTVHYVTEELDDGPIIVQEKCFVYNDDSAENLKMRVQALEAKALIKAIKIISERL